MPTRRAFKQPNRALRNLEFAKVEVGQLRATWRTVEAAVLSEIGRNLRRRTPTDYSASDDALFIPYIDAYVAGSLAPLASAFRELGRDVIEMVLEHERTTKTKVNKEQIYFAMSVNALNSGDEINTMSYWELAHRQHSKTYARRVSTKALIRKLQSHYTNVVAALEDAYHNLTLLNRIRTNYPATDEPFFATLRRLSGFHQLAYLMCGVRTRKTLWWLRRVQHFRSIRMFCRELLSQLCIICESALRDRLSAPQSALFADLLQQYAAPRLGLSSAGGSLRRMFATLPMRTDPDFNSSYPRLVAQIKRCRMPLDEQQALILYAAYAIRNKALHRLEASLWCYRTSGRIEDAVSILFAAIRFARMV